MTDYSKLSDQQINVAVGEKISFADKLLAINGQVDYCNSWSFTGPIIADNHISLLCYEDDSVAYPSSEGLVSNKVTHDKNPLRAALIVFLMMKDSENEQG